MASKEFMLSGRKLFIAIPAYDHKVTVKLAFALGRLGESSKALGVELVYSTMCGCSIVSKARNMLVDRFLASDCTDFLFVDADINFEANDVLRLLAWTGDKNIVAGIPRLKKQEIAFTAIPERNPDKSLIQDEYGLIKARRVPTAFMMVQRQVFEILRDKHPKWDYYDTVEHKRMSSIFDFEPGVGEDYVFCDRVHECGLEVWIDPFIKLGHMGVIEYESDFSKDGLTTAPPMLSVVSKR